MSDESTGRRWRTPVHVGVALALCAAAAVVRAGPLGPSSLWLDDAWVALVSKTSGVSDTFLVGLTGPGFAFLLRGWFGLVGFSETAAQLPAFAFGVVAPGLLYLVAVSRGMSFAGAFGAAGLLVASPVHIVYATRVKHYTLDTLLAVVLIGLAWAVVQQPTRRRWVILAVAAAAAVAISGGAAPVAAAALAAGALASLRRGRTELATAAVACASWGAFAIGWYLVVLRPAITPAIRGFWVERYVDSVSELLTGLRLTVEGFAALPWWVTALLVGAGLGVMVARHGAAVAALGGPIVIVCVLAVLDLAPLGGGRTDAVLYPGLALAVGALLDGLAKRLPRRPWVAAGLSGALVLAGVVVAGPAPAYPQEDVAPLVAQLESERRPGEPVVVYPSAIWAYALYASAPVAISPAPDTAWGFRPQVNDTDVTLLEAHRDDPAAYRDPVLTAVGGAETAWLVVSHARADVDGIVDALRGSGLSVHSRQRRVGAALLRWKRTS